MHPKVCPHRGRFTAADSTAISSSRKRRQQPGVDNISGQVMSICLQHDYESLAIGCNGAQEHMEFKAACSPRQQINSKLVGTEDPTVTIGLIIFRLRLSG